ncbi:MAG: mechanosensitive ion channel family protein [Proteobacteria bacterium]|nr:mechanosensitive ion channel family protein [Pseudomonadota bacterium]
MNVEQNIKQATKLIDTLTEFAVTYGFQIVGALVFLLIGLKVAGWVGRRLQVLCEARDIDVTLAKFIGNISKIVMIVFVAIITLGNFGITIAPLIALAGASAFGATIALQGPLSNYGAGLSIVLTRPFAVGNTITVKTASGVVDEITLAHTTLLGEDGERISIPNKDIVGQVLVNSQTRRVVETKAVVPNDADVDKAINAIREALATLPDMDDGPPPQVGIHDFAYGGLVLGIRFWVLSANYFQKRYAVNAAILKALRDSGTPLLSASAAVSAPSLTADEDPA